MTYRHKIHWVLGVGGALASAAAHAYIGPGAGLAVVGSLLTAILVAGLSVAALVALPFRLLMRRWKARRAEAARRDTECQS